jgi:rRNA maturation endonuclease Nob1
MKRQFEASTKVDGSIEPVHSIEVVCASCGFDLDESEISADVCTDCGAVLKLKRSVSIQVTTLPIFGGTLE